MAVPYCFELQEDQLQVLCKFQDYLCLDEADWRDALDIVVYCVEDVDYKFEIWKLTKSCNLLKTLLYAVEDVHRMFWVLYLIKRYEYSGVCRWLRRAHEKYENLTEMMVRVGEAYWLGKEFDESWDLSEFGGYDVRAWFSYKR